jgi:hypothetical protein
MTLPSLIRWSDSAWITEPNCIALIAGGLAQVLLVRFAADALTMILRKPADIALKSLLIMTHTPPDRLATLTDQHAGAPAILTSLARLIVQIGFVLVKGGNPAEFFQLALFYLRLQDEVAVHVLPFIGRYVSLIGGDSCPRTVRCLITRMAATIEAFTDTAKLASALAHLSAYSQIIAIALSADVNAVINEIEVLLKGERTMPLFGALVTATHRLVKTQFYARIGGFLSAFQAVTEWAPPLTPAQTLCVILSYDFFSDYPERFGLEHLPVLLGYLANAAIGAGDGPAGTQLSALVAKFGQSAARLVRRPGIITPEIVEGFVTTRRPDFVIAAGYLIPPDGEWHSVVEKSAQVLLAPSTRESCELALLFLTGLRREIACEYALSLYRGLQPACVGDPELLALFIRAGESLLGPNIQVVVCELADHLTEPATIASACVALAASLRPELTSARPVDPAALLQLLSAFLPAAHDDAVALPFLEFAGALFAVVQAPPDLVLLVCELARRLADTKYDSPAVMRGCAHFVSRLNRGWVPDIGELFAGPMLNAVFADDFSPFGTAWEAYAERVHAVHQRLLTGDPDGFPAVFVAAVTGFGADADFAERYLIRGECIAGARKHTKCRNLFQELLELFWGMPL